MRNKTEIAKNFAGFALTTGLAIITQGQSNLILGTLSGIAGGLATGYIDKFEFNKIKKLLKDTDPSELNHDLQKLIINALEWTILNIEILYKKDNSTLNSSQIKELDTFTKSLIEEVKILNTNITTSEPVYKTIEAKENTEKIFKTFDLKVDTFPIINQNKPYNTFFKNQFTSNLQLCFGELLKNEKNRPAFIAYQREVYQNLETNLDKVISQNEKILEALSNREEQETTKTENKKWETVKYELKKENHSTINPEFEALINTQIASVKQDTELLIDITSNIKDELERLKGITVGIRKDLKQNWIAKNKVWVFALLSIFILVIASLVYVIKTAPFQMNVGISIDQSLNIHPEYPKPSTESRLRFYLPDGNIDKELTFNNEITLTHLPHQLLNKTFKVELNDAYWQLINDSITLNKTTAQIKIKPNNRLANLFGKVQSRNLQNLIANAKITVDGISTLTDANGEFKISMPLHLRKQDYTIRAEKEGYWAKEKYGVPNDNIDILLTNKAAP